MTWQEEVEKDLEERDLEEEEESQKGLDSEEEELARSI